MGKTRVARGSCHAVTRNQIVMLVATVLFLWLVASFFSASQSADLGMWPPSVGAGYLPQPNPLFTKTIWRVDPQHSLLSVLVPVDPTPEQLGFLRNQLETFSHFFDSHSVAQYLLVSPPHKKQATSEAVASFLSKHSTIQASLFHVLSDADCSEELSPVAKHGISVSVMGAVRAQILKLACAAQITTPYYLVLDADVFYTKKASAQDLFMTFNCTKSTLVCDKAGTTGYTARNDMYAIRMRAPDTMAVLRRSAFTMKLHVHLDWRQGIGSTPQVLSTDIARQFAVYMHHRFRKGSWEHRLLEKAHEQMNRNAATGSGDLAWSELDLYWVFATHACVWEDYHVPSKTVVLQENAMWDRQVYDRWQPCRDTFSADAAGLFSLVDNWLNVHPDWIWEQIQPCLV